MLLALLLMLPKPALALSGSGTSTDPYLIGNADDWKALVELVNAGASSVNVKMTDDISFSPDVKPGKEATIDEMIGTESHPFSGTFDGQGHELFFDYDASSEDNYPAPFRYVSDATIKNMSVNILSMSNKGNYSGGIVGHVTGTLFFEDCVCGGGTFNVSNGLTASGFVGYAVKGSTVNISNCFQHTTFQRNAPYAFAYCEDGATLNITNSYYKSNARTTDQGTQVTDLQINSGEVAYKLQNGRETQVWGEAILRFTQSYYCPTLTSEDSAHVYKVEISSNVEYSSTKYVFKNETIGDLLPADLMKKYYDITFNDGYSTSTTVDKDMSVTVNAGGIYLSTANDWTNFAKIVNGGTTKLNALMTADIDLGNGTYDGMIGTGHNPYSGVFDGDGHTLTVNYTAGRDYVAPFCIIAGATIKNLHTSGTFKVSRYYAASIVACAVLSPSKIQNCRSSVNIVIPKNGGGKHGGLVGTVISGIEAISDCIFDGSITGDSIQNCGGIIAEVTGWSKNNPISISNCLMTGTFDSDNVKGSGTFVNEGSSNLVVLDNCYYLNKLGTVGDGATQVTAAQLANGEVAYKLQNGREKQVWGQTVGKDNMPLLTSDVDKHIYNNVYGSENTYDNYVVFSEDKDNAANIAAFNGMSAPVKLERSFAANTWNTLVLPFALSTGEVNTAFGADAKVAKFTNNAANTIELNYDETGADKAIEANTPVLIRVTSDVNNPTFSNCNISSSNSPQVNGEEGINFIGSYAASYTIGNGEYFISGDKLWRSNGNSTLKATRAYFTVPSSQQAKLSLIIGDDMVTGIEGVRSEKLGENPAPVYNINGQKVADKLGNCNLPKGIYIVNGKKIIVK